MAYNTHFILTDSVIAHIDTFINQVNDPFIVSRYAGFVSVMAVTVYELAVKDIFINFSNQKHRVFGEFTKNHFDRINGRINIDDLKKNTKIFGDKYNAKFTKLIEQVDQKNLRKNGKSVKTSYANVVIWRNQFAHEGQVPNQATYQEVVESYKVGKIIIDCLFATMKR
jgi:hypothetical protein